MHFLGIVHVYSPDLALQIPSYGTFRPLLNAWVFECCKSVNKSNILHKSKILFLKPAGFSWCTESNTAVKIKDVYLMK